jgi:hypothetical protein
LTVLAVIAAYGVYWTRKNHPVSPRDVRRTLMPLVQLAIIGLLLLLSCMGIAVLMMHVTIDQAWSPALVGLAWPAVIMLVAVLLMRIRLRWVKPIAIAIVLGGNLAQATAWVIHHPESRLDLVARDVARSQDRKSPVRTYFTKGIMDDLQTPTGKYYLARQGKTKLQIKPTMSQAVAARDLMHSDWVTEPIVWDTLEQPMAGEGILSAALSWRMDSQNLYPVRDHWSWQIKQSLRQRIFTHSPPTTQEIIRAKGQEEQQPKEDPDLRNLKRQLDSLQKERERLRPRSP